MAGFGFRRGGKSAIDEPLSAEQVWSRLLAWQTRRGRRAIAQRLQQKGLAAEHPALDEQTENLDWVKEAATLLQRRFGDTPIDDPKAQAKRVRFLQYRGFSLTQAIEAMKSLKSN